MKIFSKKIYARKQGICKGWHDEKCRKTKKAERESQSAYVILSGKEKVLQKVLFHMQHTFKTKDRKDDYHEEINDNYDGNRYCCNKFQRSTGAESKC